MFFHPRWKEQKVKHEYRHECRNGHLILFVQGNGPRNLIISSSIPRGPATYAYLWLANGKCYWRHFFFCFVLSSLLMKRKLASDMPEKLKYLFNYIHETFSSSFTFNKTFKTQFIPIMKFFLLTLMMFYLVFDRESSFMF